MTQTPARLSNESRTFRAARLARPLVAGLLGLGALGAAQAQEKFTYMTNWYAQAEHGGFYQALATGLYK
jgi:NitT/TauT family transport system substrate-binding protein